MNDRSRTVSTTPLAEKQPSPVLFTFEAWQQEVVQRIQSALKHALPASDKHPTRLHEAMRYAALGAGKRLRPLLCHAAGEAAAASLEALDVVGAALELIHVSSLIHDDLPALDNDSLRRGVATVHVQYDEATAILAGDALLAHAFEVLSRAPVPENTIARLMGEAATACGSSGIAGGQMIDISSIDTEIDLAQLEQMHRMKTGALIQASVRMGALCAEHTVLNLESLDRYSAALGLAFQIVDDILDATSDTQTLGKTAGKDAAAHKPTYVSVLGLERSTELAHQLGEQAHDALKTLAGRTDRLHGLADLIIKRLR